MVEQLSKSAATASTNRGRKPARRVRAYGASCVRSDSADSSRMHTQVKSSRCLLAFFRFAQAGHFELNNTHMYCTRPDYQWSHQRWETLAALGQAGLCKAGRQRQQQQKAEEHSSHAAKPAGFRDGCCTAVPHPHL